MLLVKRFSQFSLDKQSWLIFSIALLLRLIALSYLVASRGLLTIADAADYIQYGEYILQQGMWVVDIAGLRAHAGPGYPALLALDMLLFDSESFHFTLFINCIFSALAVVMVYRIAREFLSYNWSLLAMIWYLIYIPQIWQVQFLGKESIVFGLFTFSIYSMVKFHQQAELKLNLIISFFLVYTLLIHSDERYFFYFPFWMIFLLSGGQSWRYKSKNVAFLSCGIFLLMLPWTIRNAQVYGRPIILTERTAKFTDALFGYSGLDNEVREFKFSPSSVEGKAVYTAAVDSLVNGLSLKGSLYEEKTIRSIIEGLEAGKVPRAFTKLEEIVSYSVEFWRPVRLEGNFYGHGFRYMEAWSLRQAFFSIIQYGLLIPFFILSVFYVFRYPQPVVVFLISTIAIHFVIHAFLAHAITRYRYPIDPLIILLAFWTFSKVYSGFRTLNSRKY